MSQSPVWDELRAHSLSFEGATEEYPWGEVVYKVRGKVFVFTSGDRSAVSITAKPLPDRRELFLQLPGVTVAKYVGRFGWVSLVVQDSEGLELAKDLIAQSYGMIGGTRRRAATSR